MTKYRGEEVEVRIAVSTTGIGTSITSSTALTYVTSIEYKVNQNQKSSPKGLGTRMQEVYEGLIEMTGTLKREYDGLAAAGGAGEDFATWCGQATTTSLTAGSIDVYVRPLGQRILLDQTKGTYTKNSTTDQFVTEQYDFNFNLIATSTNAAGYSAEFVRSNEVLHSAD